MIDSESAEVMQFVDMHMHLGFANDLREFACRLEEGGIAAFSNTVTPGEYEKLKMSTGEVYNLRLGLGFHPWWIKNSTSFDEMLALFDSQLEETLFIGEVGLDFYGRHAATRELQIRAFTHIASACKKRGGFLLSMHSVRAEIELIDILETTGCLQNCTCILHSFSGPSDQLKRAIDAKCLFSIGQRMLSTKKGREYARIIPQDLLLLETDLPKDSHETCDAEDIVDSLQGTLRDLATLRSCEMNALAESIFKRSMYLLDL